MAMSKSFCRVIGQHIFDIVTSASFYLNIHINIFPSWHFTIFLPLNYINSCLFCDVNSTYFFLETYFYLAMSTSLYRSRHIDAITSSQNEFHFCLCLHSISPFQHFPSLTLSTSSPFRNISIFQNILISQHLFPNQYHETTKRGISFLPHMHTCSCVTIWHRDDPQLCIHHAHAHVVINLPWWVISQANLHLEEQ